MQMPEFMAQYTGQPIAAIAGLWAVDARADGTFAVTKWSIQGSTAPTSAQIVTGLAQPDTVAFLAAILLKQASAACDAIVAQVANNQTRTSCYMLAYSLVGANGASPSVDPAKTVFANLATAKGMQPQQLATLIAGIALAPLQIDTVLSTFESAVANASGATELATALNTFETSLSAEVTSLNAAGLTTTITAPPAISVAGVNAS